MATSNDAAAARSTAAHAGLDAWRRLRAAGEPAWLFAGAGAHPEAAATHLLWSPARRLRLTGSAVMELGPDDTWHPLPGPPWATLARELDRADASGRHPGRLHLDETGDSAQDAGTPPVRRPLGGPLPAWAATLHYEALHLLEPTLPRPAGFADMVLGEFALCHAAATWHQDGRHQQHGGTPLDDLPATASPGTPGLTDKPAGGDPLPTTRPRWRRSLDADAFQAAVVRIRDRVHDGDLFQANIATAHTTDLAPGTDPADLFGRLIDANPSPYMALLPWDDATVVSGSPELLFAVHGDQVRARPIAGTTPRHADAAADRAAAADLAADPKEQAEHTMLVDLVRNDIARVAVPGTTHVPEFLSIESYRHVHHLVSGVEGRLAPGRSGTDCLAALFPGGTITGAPKHRAAWRIAETEPVRRGPYTGSAGIIWANGDATWNILIRTLVVTATQATVHAGSGIVADSDPEREWQEAGHKARALLEAVTGSTTDAPAPTSAGTDAAPGRWPIGTVTPRSGWRHPDAQPCPAGRRVLLIDNYDSFVYNLADYCAASGAEVRVRRNDASVHDDLEWATHVILSPGPGHPHDAGTTRVVAATWTGPLLGVCLGHQAMAHVAGARIHRCPPVHGRPDAVRHDGTGILAGLPDPLPAARYHSLVVAPDSLPPSWRPTAHLDDGTLMAMTHNTLPQWGLQFHPESVATPHGLQIIAAFLAS